MSPDAARDTEKADKMHLWMWVAVLATGSALGWYVDVVLNDLLGR